MVPTLDSARPLVPGVSLIVSGDASKADVERFVAAFRKVVAALPAADRASVYERIPAVEIRASSRDFLRTDPASGKLRTDWAFVDYIGSRASELAFSADAVRALPDALLSVLVGYEIAKLVVSEKTDAAVDAQAKAWGFDAQRLLDWAATPDGQRLMDRLTRPVERQAFGLVVGHTDVAHLDAHADAGHADVSHTDTHSDVPHQDAAHADTAHSDTHGDSAHSDGAHSDTHSDVAHSDVSHQDSHSDVAHNDTHSDVAHEDTHSDVLHSDGHIDEIDPHADIHFDEAHVDQHSDGAHTDVHGDGAHSDTHNDFSHQDSHTDLHSDTPHVDVSHGDTHADAGHGDAAHADGAHADQHTDVAHQDTGHGDSHGDSPHGDAN